MILNTFDSDSFDRGASLWREAAWLLVAGILFSSWLPGSGWRIFLLRRFGARIGSNVTFKPGVRVKFPWRLTIGEHCWIGESVWIDNLVEVTIGDHVCISQGAYLCTGSHDWSSERFDLIVRPIIIGARSWIGAKAVLAPGAHIGEGSVITLGTVAGGTLEPWHVHSGGVTMTKKPRWVAPPGHDAARSAADPDFEC